MGRRDTRTRRSGAFQPEILEDRGLLSTLGTVPRPAAEIHATASRVAVTLQGKFQGTAIITPRGSRRPRRRSRS